MVRIWHIQALTSPYVRTKTYRPKPNFKPIHQMAARAYRPPILFPNEICLDRECVDTGLKLKVSVSLKEKLYRITKVVLVAHSYYFRLTNTTLRV